MKAARLWRLLALLLAVGSILPGCMYGDQIKRAGAPASGEYIALVQSAMEQYRTKTGVLPIRNKEAATSDYERYRIDFKKLQDSHILMTVPTNAFENGGTAIYVVARTESIPVVKLLDLVSFQQIGELQQKVDTFKSTHNGEQPRGDLISEGYWQLNYSKLNSSRVVIRSPYSMTKLYPVMNAEGKVGIDYAPELLKLVQRKSLKPDSQLDLRELLLDYGYFVPACSFPYSWSGQAPVLKIF